MKQHNEIGKYVKKDEYLNGKKNRIWISPKGIEYQFDYIKEGRKYIFILMVDGIKMKINEPDFNRSNIDDLILIIKRDSLIK